MIGVNRKVYPNGVYQGQDLFDKRVSLIQYKELFNAFPQVKFPDSRSSARRATRELVSYAWIFPNVITNGSWWYRTFRATSSWTPSPGWKLCPRPSRLVYYSDMYKLSSAFPSSACTAASWARSWPRTSSSDALVRNAGTGAG